MNYFISNMTMLKIINLIFFAVTSLAARAATFELHSVSEFSEKYELVYFYSHSCSHCRTFTPVLVKYAKDNRLGIAGFVLGEDISFVQQPTADLPVSIGADWEITEKFFSNTKVVAPALFLVNKRTFRAYSVACGALSYQELASRIKQLQQQILAREHD